MIMQSQQPVDWHHIQPEEHRAPAVVDSRARLHACLILFLVGLALVLGRVVYLELAQGAAFRRVAGEPLVEREDVPSTRGRILSRDGTVLAHDKRVISLAVRYRYLENPPEATWLRSMARSRLSREARRDPKRVAAEQRRVRRECRDLQWQLASLCGLSTTDWNRRAAEVQIRVERIAESVNRRRRETIERHERRRTLFDRWFGTADEPRDERTIVREELDYHVMAENVPLSVVAEIEGHPERYPGVRIIEHGRRDYREGSLAAHVLGYLGSPTEDERKADEDTAYNPDDRRGRQGLERQFEQSLRGRRGQRVEKTDRSGRIISIEWNERPRPGEDLILTLDARLQKTAETLLDEALARRELTGAKPPRAGAAAIVMDVRTGAILAAASAPRFDPNVFGGKASDQIRQILKDPDKPLFHRAIQMAIAPGSVFKVLSAVALIESGTVRPDEFFYCRGYLERPNALRCQIYKQFQRGHGEVRLADALAVSCNVYFFHHAAQAGPDPLVHWAKRFEFGRVTGVDLPGEASGRVPTPETIKSLERHAWTVGDTRRLAVGQGSLTVTPLQIARMTAAVANGGWLVTPHVVSLVGTPEQENRETSKSPISTAVGRHIDGLNASTLETIRRGMRRAVESPLGTAYGTVSTDFVEVAGKTGTAETGRGRSDHAWFAGYLPAAKPRFALVIVVEHSGDGADVAGPVARRLILRMHQLGLLFSGEKS
ncbi:MAG: hypothetical protein JW888_00025 [Pirellulales bacterium]|nr:hypothetical protein [Pirellulales bacterium]